MSKSDSDGSAWVESDDSDLKEHIGQNGVVLTAGIIAADVIGAGILAMPAAIANLGFYPGGKSSGKKGVDQSEMIGK